MKFSDVVSAATIAVFLGALFINASITDRSVLDVLNDWISWARKKLL